MQESGACLCYTLQHALSLGLIGGYHRCVLQLRCCVKCRHVGSVTGDCWKLVASRRLETISRQAAPPQFDHDGLELLTCARACGLILSASANDLCIERAWPLTSHAATPLRVGKQTPHQSATATERCWSASSDSSQCALVCYYFVVAAAAASAASALMDTEQSAAKGHFRISAILSFLSRL